MEGSRQDAFNELEESKAAVRGPQVLKAQASQFYPL